MKAVMVQINSGEDARTVFINQVNKIVFDNSRLIINTDFRHYTGFYYIDWPMSEVKCLYTTDVWTHDPYALVIWQ